MNSKLTVERLHRLNTLLNKYGHRWGETASQRMYDWVDEYTAAHGTPVWNEFCAKYGRSTDHDAYDCMA